MVSAISLRFLPAICKENEVYRFGKSGQGVSEVNYCNADEENKQPRLTLLLLSHLEEVQRYEYKRCQEYRAVCILHSQTSFSDFSQWEEFTVLL